VKIDARKAVLLLCTWMKVHARVLLKTVGLLTLVSSVYCVTNTLSQTTQFEIIL